MTYNAKIRILSFLIMLTFIGCSVDKEAEFEKLEENVEGYDDLRLLIEAKYKNRLADDTRPRLVFLDCIEADKSIQDYVCDDKIIISKMESLGIKEIRFERKKCEDKLVSDVYFQTSKVNHYPIVYYLFEGCGAGDPFESSNIFYKPLDDNWGLYIDSSFP